MQPPPTNWRSPFHRDLARCVVLTVAVVGGIAAAAGYAAVMNLLLEMAGPRHKLDEFHATLLVLEGFVIFLTALFATGRFCYARLRAWEEAEDLYARGLVLTFCWSLFGGGSLLLIHTYQLISGGRHASTHIVGICIALAIMAPVLRLVPRWCRWMYRLFYLMPLD